MILQLCGIAGCLWGIDYIKFRPKRLIKNKWNLIMIQNNLVNELGETFNIAKINDADYGFLLIVGIPTGFSFNDLDKIKPKIEDGLKCLVEMEHNKLNGWIKVRLIMKPFEEREFKPIRTMPYELYVGYNHLGPVIINMNKFPHILITGVTGSGKNSALEIILANLMANHSKDKVQFFLTQLMKKELIYFKRYENVVGMAFNLNEAVTMFEEIEKIINERVNLIFNYAEKGIKNIDQYNEKFKDKQLSYVYVVIDEYAFYMPEKADSKEEKLQKAYCLSVIKKILLDGRALGVFGVILIQRPDSESINSTFKAQVTNILCFRQSNEISSRVAIETDEATKLETREAILKTNKYERIKTPFISDEIIRTALKHREKKKGEIVKSNMAILENFEIREITKEEYEDFVRRVKKGKQKFDNFDGLIKRGKGRARNDRRFNF